MASSHPSTSDIHKPLPGNPSDPAGPDEYGLATTFGNAVDEHASTAYLSLNEYHKDARRFFEYFVRNRSASDCEIARLNAEKNDLIKKSADATAQREALAGQLKWLLEDREAYYRTKNTIRELLDANKSDAVDVDTEDLLADFDFYKELEDAAQLALPAPPVNCKQPLISAKRPRIAQAYTGSGKPTYTVQSDSDEEPLTVRQARLFQ